MPLLRPALLARAGLDWSIPAMSADHDIAPQGMPGELLDLLRWDERGLVSVVAQDAEDGAILMVAWANRSAVEATLRTGIATYFSRSRQRLWVKGEESGHTQAVVEIRADCDGDCLLYLVRPQGPACHTGRRSCFFWSSRPDGALREVGG